RRVLAGGSWWCRSSGSPSPWRGILGAGGPSMPVTVTEAERASFLRCGRRWDIAAGMRPNIQQNMRPNLEPANRPAAPDLDRAIRDALAAYYFPGMWDWD